MKPFLLITVTTLILAALAEGGPSASPFSHSLPPCVPGKIPHSEFLDLPPAWRQSNYGPSCAWATTISMLRAQEMFTEADQVRKLGYGGAGPSDINRVLDRLGIKYTFTTDGDTRLLDYALETNRGCGVHWYTGHATMLVGRTSTHAIILDNNRTSRYVRVPWQQFVREWRNNGGWGWVIVDPRGKPMPETKITL